MHSAQYIDDEDTSVLRAVAKFNHTNKGFVIIHDEKVWHLWCNWEKNNYGSSPHPMAYPLWCSNTYKMHPGWKGILIIEFIDDKDTICKSAYYTTD